MNRTKYPIKWRFKNFYKFFEDEDTTCHRCKLKNTKLKLKCSNCFNKSNVRTDGVYCYSCLKNGFNISINELYFEDPWWCPKCCNECNCASCRKKIK